MDFLARLEQLSRSKGIYNNYQLAERSGVPYTTIDNFYRKGYENVKLSTLRKFASFFGCSLDRLISGSPDECQPDINEGLIGQKEYQLIKKYRALNERDKSNVDNIIDSLYKKN